MNCRSNKLPPLWPKFPVLPETAELSEDGTKVTVDAQYFRELLLFRMQYENLQEVYDASN